MRDRQSSLLKLRSMMANATEPTCIHNTLKFRFVQMDSWFSSEENFDYITSKGQHFIAALKDNRLLYT